MDSGDLDQTTEPDLLSEEDWQDLVDEIEHDDPTYQQDAALVADLFRQVAPYSSFPPTIVPDDPLDQLPEIITDDTKNFSGHIAIPAPASDLEETAVFKGWLQRVKRTSPIWMLAGIVAVATITLLGAGWCQNCEFLPHQSSPRSR